MTDWDDFWDDCSDLLSRKAECLCDKGHSAWCTGISGTDIAISTTGIAIIVFLILLVVALCALCVVCCRRRRTRGAVFRAGDPATTTVITHQHVTAGQPATTAPSGSYPQQPQQGYPQPQQGYPQPQQGYPQPQQGYPQPQQGYPQPQQGYPQPQQGYQQTYPVSAADGSQMHPPPLPPPPQGPAGYPLGAMDAPPPYDAAQVHQPPYNPAFAGGGQAAAAGDGFTKRPL